MSEPLKAGALHTVTENGSTVKYKLIAKGSLAFKNLEGGVEYVHMYV